MKLDDIMQMAKVTGFAVWHKDLKQFILEPGAELFAELVAAAEREACAKVCEEDFGNGALNLANAIRARGNK